MATLDPRTEIAPAELELGAAAEALVAVARTSYARGWALGTSGNFSAVLSRSPFRLAITASGCDKGSLATADVVVVDGAGTLVAGSGRPSDELSLHLALALSAGANAVLHTHSVWSTILSEVHAERGGLELAGFEMLKGLAGVRTHDHREWLPIFENTQSLADLAREVGRRASAEPRIHGFFLRRHGLYTWGDGLAEARRHLEVLEFLLEVVGRERAMS
jgi:methylthioribulose-1-phosphate dehydratase